MPSFLSNIFNSASSLGTPVGAKRTVNLSGNYFSFSMPEDFSKDMPAEDLVESLAVTNLEKFNDSEYGNLIRRWWDIKKPGLFGKNIGIVMMDISVQRASDNKQLKIHDRAYNLSERLDLLLMIDDTLHQRYDELVAQTKGLDDGLSYYVGSFAQLLGKKIGTGFRDRIYNNQKWIGYSVLAPSNQLITGLVTPLTNQLYLEVMFTFSPNKNVLPREFREYAYQKIQIIEDSLRIDYAKENAILTTMKSKEWLTVTNDQVLQSNQELLLVPFFGPNIYKQLALHDQQVAEAMKVLARPDE
jgi:hypothetical protein